MKLLKYLNRLSILSTGVILASHSCVADAGAYSLTDITSVPAGPSSLSVDSYGNLYGVSGSTVFEVLAGTHTMQSVATVPSANGPLLVDSSNNLYGTTYSASTHSASLYEIPANSHVVSTLTTAFNTYQTQPFGKLAINGNGTIVGGSITSAPWEFSTTSNQFNYLLGFTSSSGYSSPSTGGGITRDNAGNLYAGFASGQIVELPNGYQSNPNIAGIQLANLRPDAFLECDLTVDSNHDVFGRTYYGTIFEVPSGGSLQILANLNPGAVDPGNPGSAWLGPSGVYVDAAGDIFGTEEMNTGSAYTGAVFELPAGSSTIQTLASFPGDGIQTDLTPDSAGNLYGVTNAGQVFELAIAVPEPTSLMLAMIGGVVLARRRRFQ